MNFVFVMSLIKKRGTVKAQFTKLRNFIENESGNASISKLKTKLELLDKEYVEFCATQDQIEAACDDAKLGEEQAERCALDDLFCDLKSELLDLIEEKTPSRDNHHHESSNNRCCQNQRASEVELPKIKLEIYNGKPEEWFQFYDLFVASVDSKNLTPAQKFYYLRNHLQGPPLKAISQLKMEDASYRIALDRLKEKYANKGIILNTHLKALLSVNMCDGSSNSLKNLADTLQLNIQAVNNLGYESSKLSDAIIVFLASAKLDARTRELWETKIVGKIEKCDDLLNTFVKCIDERACTLQAMPPPPPPPSTRASTSGNRVIKKSDDSRSKPIVSSNATNVERAVVTCPLCESGANDHQLFACPVFAKYTYDERVDFIQKGNRCFNCLRQGHRVSACLSSSRCKSCEKNHHTMIHRAKPTQPNNDAPAALSIAKKPESTSQSNDTVAANAASVRKSNSVLIATVCVLLESTTGERLPVRAMLDPGAEENFISQKLANQLGLPMRKRPVQLIGLNGARSTASMETTIKFYSRVTNYSSSTSAIVVPKVTAVNPPSTVSASSFNIPFVEFADPEFDKPGQIDLLLCAEYYLDIFTDGYIPGDGNRPSIRNSVFGWIVSGRTQTSDQKTISVHRCEIARALENFWSIEEVNVEVPRSAEDEYCEKLYSETVSRDPSGRYTVHLLLKDSVEKLGESRETALKILTGMRKRLTETQFASCKAFMDEYIALGHMSPAPMIEGDQPHYYLPYHPVFKETSLTTKTRLVFNGSKPTSTGVSINDILYKGPKSLQKKLFLHLLRFRAKLIAISADVAMMYRQVLIYLLHRNLQRILWFNENGEIVDFVLNTVTYGMTPSAFLAIRTLFQLANDERVNYPIAAAALEEDSYVDDVHTGADSREEAAELVRQLDALTKKGGFTLRKWASNDPSVLDSISSEEISFKLSEEDEVGALGLTWHTTSDKLIITGKLPESTKAVTKRIILSESSKLFDPLGLVAPVVVVAKLILKRLWNAGVNWDDSLDEEIQRDWLNYREALNSMIVSIPRLTVTSAIVELHGFCDASMHAYGACVYVRAIHPDGAIQMRLLCAKTRVAPSSCENVPRLELLGAVLLARLVSQVLQFFGVKFSATCLWSDSTIVLSWLAKDPSCWKQFVANRVREIQELVPSSCWRYVKSADNPADIASRGVSPLDMANLSLWLNGPTFLQNSFEMSDVSEFVDERAMEEARRRKVAVHRINAENHAILQLIEKRSSAKKIIRVAAYCLRFIRNLKVEPTLRLKEPANPLSVDELTRARIFVIRAVQEDGFPDDLKKLTIKGKVGKRSSILSCNPELDDDGIIRVGGRLKNSNITENQKHPIILPARHPFSLRVARESHIEAMHAPTNLLISTIRNEYWIIALKSLARSIVHNCPICRRMNARSCQQIMGNLPDVRVNAPDFPFQNVGLDFAGPITVKPGPPRSKITSKAYICLFICLATKAVHIDVAMNLSTESFIAALERFVARRGRPESIYSDNGTNFKGAANQLEKLCNDSDVQDDLTSKRIRWHFIPPGSPHFGGIWEAAIKSTKTHLKRAIGEAVLSQEHLLTLLAKIEACLNSRPLYEPSDDAIDGPPLTPGHFLIGRPLISIPQPSTPIIIDHRNKFDQIRRVVRSFWTKWSKEYLHNLQERSKWKSVADNIAVGDIVVIKEVDHNPGNWKMGRIVQVYPGNDNLTRVADVKTASGTLQRPITKLIVLVHK